MELLIVSPMSMGGSEEEIMLRLSSQDRHALHSIHKFDLAADTESVHLLLQLAHSISSIRWKIIYNDMSCPVQPHLEKLVVICGRIETAFNQADFWMKRLAVKDPLSLYDKVVQHILNREVRDLSPSIVTSSSSSFASSPLLLLAKRAHSIHFFRLLLSDTSISSTVFLEKDATLSSLDTSAATTITSTPALQTAADLNSFKNALRLYTEQLLDAASFQRYKVAVIMVLEHASIVSQMISSSRGGGGGQEHDAGRMNNNESAEEATSSSASLMEELFEFYGRLLLDSLLAKRAPLDLLQSTIAGIDERVSFQISLHLVVHCKVVMENLLAVVEGSRPWNSRTNDNNNMVDGESLWTEEDCLLWNDEAVTMFCKFVRTCCHFVVTKCTTTSSSSSSSVSSPESKRIRQACLDVVGCITRFFDWIDSNLKVKIKYRKYVVVEQDYN